MLTLYDLLRTTHYWVAFGGAVVCAALLTPFVIALANRVGAVDGGGYRKLHARPTPLMGGLAVAIPFLAFCLLGLFGPTAMLEKLAPQADDLFVLIVGASVILLLGAFDDIRGLRARHKFVVQIIVALFVCASGHMIFQVNLPFFGIVPLGFVFGCLLTIAWIVGLTNALNIVDGMDGLASGIAFFAAFALGIVAALNEGIFVGLLCFALAGALLGFLLFNFHPARIFLGDTGSLFLGFVLATVVLMGSHKSTGAILFLTPVLALGIPIFETLISMLRRAICGLPLFTGDSQHTHHRLLRRGFSQRQAALTLYVGAACCFLAAVLNELVPRNSWQSALPVALYVVTIMVVVYIAGYYRPVTRLRQRRRHNTLRQSLSRYVSAALSTGQSPLTMNELLEITRRELALSELRVWRSDTFETLGQAPPSPIDEFASTMLEPDTHAGLEHVVRVSQGTDCCLVVSFNYEHEVDDAEASDTQACLAASFEGLCERLLREHEQRALTMASDAVNAQGPEQLELDLDDEGPREEA